MKHPFLPLAATILSLCASSAWAADVTWNNTNNTDGAAYTTDSNWSGNSVPGSGDRPMLTNGGKILIQGGDAIVSNGARVQSGSITMSGGTWNTSSGQLNVGFQGTGSLFLSGNAAVTASTLYLANSGGTGTLSLSGTSSYTASSSGYTIIGRAGSGTLNVSGNATFTSESGSFFVGSANAGGTGIINLTENGALTSTSLIRLGYEGTVSEGTINISGAATLNAHSGIYVGDYKEGSGSTSSTGTLNVNGGTVAATYISLATNIVSSGTLNFNGGTIETEYLTKGAGTAAINLNGGTFKVGYDTADFFYGFSSSEISLLTGGVTFDTNGFNVDISQGLNGSGGLTKKGLGTLTLNAANQIGGNITVEEGALILAANNTFGSSTILNLFADTELTIDSTSNYLLSGLVIDGLSIDAGTYDDSALQDKLSDLGISNVSITLTSGATLTIIPEPSTYASLGALASLAVVLIRRRKNRTA